MPPQLWDFWVSHQRFSMMNILLLCSIILALLSALAAVFWALWHSEKVKNKALGEQHAIALEIIEKAKKDADEMAKLEKQQQEVKENELSKTPFDLRNFFNNTRLRGFSSADGSEKNNPNA